MLTYTILQPTTASHGTGAPFAGGTLVGVPVASAYAMKRRSADTFVGDGGTRVPNAGQAAIPRDPLGVS